MTKEEPETPPQSRISQTDALIQPQPQTSVVTTVQHSQSIIRTPSDDKELQSFNQMETDITQDPERVHFGEISDTCQPQSLNESTDTLENREEQSNPFASKETKPNVPFPAICIKDSKAACQSSHELREKMSQLLIDENPQSHCRTETGYAHTSGSKANEPRCKGYEKQTDVKLMVRIDDRIPKGSQEKLKNTLGTGPALLPPPPGHRECGSNIRPTSTEDRRRPNRHMLIHFVKSTGLDASAKKCFENRDIFEAGGDESLNPRLNNPLGNFHSEGEEIEYLSAETPEPQVFITPTVSVEPETRISWWVRLGAVIFLVKRFCKLSQEKLEKQFAKAPLFYLISVVVILISAIILPGRESDADIFICLIVAFIVCIIITIALDRGQWSKSIEKIGETSLSGLFDRDSCCCGRFRGPEPETERHSQYNRLVEEKDTVFEHEIADVSNIDPNDCPQMRIVEQHGMLSPGSPDYPHDISQVNVDVHVPGTTRNSEVGAISKHRDQGIYKKSAKSHCKIKSKVSSAPLKLPKSVKADVHFPETVSNLKGGARCERRAQDATRGFPELSHISDASRDKLKIFREFSTQVTKSGSIKTPVLEANPKGFTCEHSDQGLACSCSAYATRKNVESRNEFKTFNEESSLLHESDDEDIIFCSAETMNRDGTFSDSEASKGKPLKLSCKKSPYKSKENLVKLSDSPLTLLQTIHVDNNEPETSKNPKNVSSELYAQNVESEVPEFSQ